MPMKILVVDDHAPTVNILARILTHEGYEVVAAYDGPAALARIKENDLNLVLLDLAMPGMDGLAVLRELRNLRPSLPVVMMSAQGSISTAVEAVKLGAYDFLEKPFADERLLVSVRNALVRDQLQREVNLLRAESGKRFQMLGASPAMGRVIELIERAAPVKSSVLILGESGTGKELVARAIHNKSPRAGKSWVPLNCAAIPSELVESELFGHERGAFTGATAQKPGKLELADEGTLFLDEIADMSLPAQAKLLRFLQEGEFQRVGGTRTITVDTRVVAATRKNPIEEIKAGQFREDLYYRLNVINIQVPPLRERREDIPLLAQHFLVAVCDENGIPATTMTDDALAALTAHDWPGNVRELRNIAERLAVLTRASEITAADVNLVLSRLDADPGGLAPTSQTLRQAVEDFERKFILGLLERKQWNISEAARILDVDRRHLYRILERLGIKLPAHPNV
ncbi:MAG: sigma-54 dependent transcriptional regulator [candidate division WOR-3 bacterium]